MDVNYFLTINKQRFNNDLGIIFYFCSSYKIETYEEKLLIFLQILNSPFTNNESKKKYIKMMKIYNKYNYYINIIQKKWKFNRYKIYDCDCDLTMVPLNEFKNNELITFVQNDTIYTFTIKDMLSIIQNSLFSCEYLNEKPSHPKNPYNNIILPNHVLYNLYIKCKNQNIQLNYFVKQYYLCDFCLYSFRCQNNFKLGMNAIKQYIIYTPDELIYDEIYDMIFYINIHNLHIKYNIIETITLVEPDNINEKYMKKIIKLCKKMLFPYFMHLYRTQHDAMLNKYYINKMMTYLKTIINYNPNFWCDNVSTDSDSKTLINPPFNFIFS